MRACRLVLACLVLALLPAPSWAVSACCPAEISATQSVASAVVSMNQSLAVVLTKLGKAVTQQLVANNHSQLTAIETQTRVFEQIMKTHAATLASQQAQRDFGVAGEVTVNGRRVVLSSRSPTLCDELRAAQLAALHADKMDEVRALFKADQSAHNRAATDMERTAEHLRATDASGFDVTWLGLEVLTEDEVLAANEQIKHLTNPLPLPALPTDKAATPAGEDYMLQRDLINAQVEIAQAAMSENLALRSPVLEDEAGEKSSALAEMQGRVERTIDDMGADAWLKKIERKGIAALVRELNITAAHIYKLNLAQYRADLRRNNLLAVLVSHANKAKADSVYTEHQNTLRNEK